jgi:hypothetical protein
METLVSFITPLKGTKIFIDVDKNKLLTTSENGKVKSKNILSNIIYITNSLAENQYDVIKSKAVGNEFILPLDVIKEMLSYISSVNAKDMIFNVDKNKITLTIENKQDEIEASFDLVTPDTLQPVSLKLAYYFTDILALAETDIVISVKPNSPVFVKISQYDSDFEYLLLQKNQKKTNGADTADNV